jgi:hypothetical protein
MRMPSARVPVTVHVQVQKCRATGSTLTYLVGTLMFLASLITKSFPHGQHSIPSQLIDEDMCSRPAHRWYQRTIQHGANYTGFDSQGIM